MADLSKILNLNNEAIVKSTKAKKTTKKTSNKKSGIEHKLTIDKDVEIKKEISVNKDITINKEIKPISKKEIEDAFGKSKDTIKTTKTIDSPDSIRERDLINEIHKWFLCNYHFNKGFDLKTITLFNLIRVYDNINSENTTINLLNKVIEKFHDIEKVDYKNQVYYKLTEETQTKINNNLNVIKEVIKD